MRKPDNYLVWAILSTVFCCLPLGIVAIVKASKVDALWAQGLQEEAIEAANDAKKWSIIGAVSGVLGVVLYVVFCLVLGFAAAGLSSL
jgi:hypothetical protein